MFTFGLAPAKKTVTDAPPTTSSAVLSSNGVLLSGTEEPWADLAGPHVHTLSMQLKDSQGLHVPGLVISRSPPAV